MPKKKTVFGVIAFVMFFLMLGTVGAIEQDMIPLLQGMIRTFAFMALWVLFSWLAGAFEPTPERSEPREVQTEVPDARSSRPGREGPCPSGRPEDHCRRN